MKCTAAPSANLGNNSDVYIKYSLGDLNWNVQHCSANKRRWLGHGSNR